MDQGPVYDADRERIALRAGALTRILILGGYGGFGARLSRRLAGRGHQVLVAGRSLTKAEVFCETLPGAAPLAADRNGDLGPLLDLHRPQVLIDAAGPFQGSDYSVPTACIAAGVAYVDLADARAFVGGIAALDAEARTAGVGIVTGASSVPALSGAVARHLAADLTRVRSVEIAISASNRATAGTSVAAAILSYVGRPLTLWREQRWDRAWGWQALKREHFELGGGPRLAGRWIALADVPDHDLLVAALPGRPAVIFRAGTEMTLQTLGLWLLSWPVRWLGLRGLSRLAPLLKPLQQLTARFTDDRSAMSVRLIGDLADGRSVERLWTLIASDGDGPEIPTLAAVLIAETASTPGARDAGGLLALADFEPLFAPLSIRHQTRETPRPPPLYRRVMGEAYGRLPASLRRLHDVQADGGMVGEATVECGTNPLARLIATVMRFPPAGKHLLHVGFSERNGAERWTRSFGQRRFSSELSERRGRLVERFGPLRFTFDLPSDETGLAMRIVGWSAFDVPLPLALAPRSEAREWQDEDGRFHFEAPIALPLIGLVVRYEGWLEA